ncbi:NfeD family protein [Chloroflexota bacterium]
MKRNIKDWVVILVLLLDEVVIVAVVFLILWAAGVEIPLWITIPVALLLGALVFIMHKAVVPTLRWKKITGSEGMIGLTGTVIKPLTPVGTVRVGDENWKAESTGGDLAAGEVVEITEVAGLKIKVRPQGQ